MRQFIYLLCLGLVGPMAQAQVKVGALHTTLGADSNLEIEATNGNKVRVSKATGAVTIQDGTQGAGRVFTSDANGVGHWQVQQESSGSAAVAVSIVRPNTAQTFANGVSSLLTTPTTLSVTAAGTYQVSIRWWGTASQVRIPGGTNTFLPTVGVVSALIGLRKNGVLVDEINQYITTIPNEGFTFTLNLLATDCVVGDILSIAINSSAGGGSWKTGQYGLITNVMPTVLMQKL